MKQKYTSASITVKASALLHCLAELTGEMKYRALERVLQEELDRVRLAEKRKHDALAREMAVPQGPRRVVSE